MSQLPRRDPAITEADRFRAALHALIAAACAAREPDGHRRCNISRRCPMRWPIADRPGSYPLRAHGRRLVAGERKGRGRLCHYVVRRGFGSPVTLPEDECANAI